MENAYEEAIRLTDNRYLEETAGQRLSGSLALAKWDAIWCEVREELGAPVYPTSNFHKEL